MKKYASLTTVLVLAIVMTATSAFAWRSVRTGQKNFERAWSAMHFKRMDQAKKDFTKAADAFGQALAEQPPSRTTMFASNLTMAGISLYYGGRYQECIDAMDKAVRKDKRIWEGYLYKALSLAAMDDKAETAKTLRAYLQSSPGQPILSNEVKRQITNLETDSGTLADARSAIDKAATEQFENNYTLRRPSSNNDLCSGIFWWRYDNAPCVDKFPRYNN